MSSKRAMSFLAFPAITYWILVRFGNTFYCLLAARFITGWTVGGMQSGVALYVSEISNDSIRGRLGSITPLSRNIGVLIGYVAGATVEFENRPYIFVFFPIMFLIWLYSLPNTPLHYIQTEQFEVSFFNSIFCILRFNTKQGETFNHDIIFLYPRRKPNGH